MSYTEIVIGNKRTTNNTATLLSMAKMLARLLEAAVIIVEGKDYDIQGAIASHTSSSP